VALAAPDSVSSPGHGPDARRPDGGTNHAGDPGREDWKRKWLAEGRAEGRAETLIRLVERRFGPLPDDRRIRILTADETTLLVWLDRLFDATGVDDLLAPPH
jgi:hypothetical protein